MLVFSQLMLSQAQAATLLKSRRQQDGIRIRGVSHNPGKPKPYHVSGAGQAWWGKKVHLPSVEAPQLLPVRDRPLGSID